MIVNAFQLGTELAWEDAGDGVQRQIYGYNDQVMMVRVKFVTGAIGTPHSHPHTQVSYVESGIFVATIGSEKKRLVAGDGFFVQPRLVHGVICEQAGVLIDCFAPFREDFVSPK